jgi:carboxymethylenebutenolidase
MERKISGKMIPVKAGKGYFVEESGPGVLVLHASWGLNDFFKGFCDRLSEEGFAVLALDLYQGRVAATVEDAKRLRQAVDRNVVNLELKSAVAFLREKNENKLAIIGFSMGANLALWTMDNCAQDVGATVLYYGTSGGRFRRAKCPVLGHFAEHDPYARPEQIRALQNHLESQNIPHVFHIYPDTQHWFVEEDRPEYDPSAASRAWERTIAFLRSSLRVG